MQSRKQLFVPDEEAAVEQRDGELNVVLIEASAVVDGASGGTDAQAGVPEFLADAADRVLGARSQCLVLAEKKQIDVGVRIERPPSEAAQRHQREAGIGAQRGLLFPQMKKQLVNQLGAVLRAGAA